MPKIDVTFNKNILAPVQYMDFKLMASSLTLIFPKERHLGEEKKKQQNKVVIRLMIYKKKKKEVDFFAIKKQRRVS